MTMLTANELIQIRTDVAELMPDTCRIERPTIGNSNGYTTETWGTAVASAACRFDPDTMRKQTETVAERNADIAPYLVTMAYDTDVRDGDRLIYSGGTYHITQLHEVHSNRFVRRVRVSLIRGE